MEIKCRENTRTKIRNEGTVSPCVINISNFCIFERHRKTEVRSVTKLG